MDISGSNNASMSILNTPYTNIELIKISSNISMVLPNFPNLKSVLIDSYVQNINDIYALNKLKLLRQLSIQITPTSNYRGLLESLRLTNLTYLTLSAARIGLQQQMFENITITFLKNNPNIVDLTINVPFDVNSKSIETQKYILINLPHLKRYCCHPKFTTFNDKSIDAVTFFQLFLSENIKLETLVFKTPQTTNNLKEIIQFGVQLFRRKKPSMKFSCA